MKYTITTKDGTFEVEKDGNLSIEEARATVLKQLGRAPSGVQTLNETKEQKLDAFKKHQEAFSTPVSGFDRLLGAAAPAIQAGEQTVAGLADLPRTIVNQPGRLANLVAGRPIVAEYTGMGPIINPAIKEIEQVPGGKLMTRGLGAFVPEGTPVGQAVAGAQEAGRDFITGLTDPNQAATLVPFVGEAGLLGKVGQGLATSQIASQLPEQNIQGIQTALSPTTPARERGKAAMSTLLADLFAWQLGKETVKTPPLGEPISMKESPMDRVDADVRHMVRTLDRSREKAGQLQIPFEPMTREQALDVLSGPEPKRWQRSPVDPMARIIEQPEVQLPRPAPTVGTPQPTVEKVAQTALKKAFDFPLVKTEEAKTETPKAAQFTAPTEATVEAVKTEEPYVPPAKQSRKGRPQNEPAIDWEAAKTRHPELMAVADYYLQRVGATKPKVVANYKRDLRVFVKYLDETKQTLRSPEVFQNYQAWLKENYKNPDTANAYMGTVRRLTGPRGVQGYDLTHKTNLESLFKPAGIVLERLDTSGHVRKADAYTAEEMAKLRTAAVADVKNSKRNAAIIDVLSTTGSRGMGPRELTFQDLRDLDKGTLYMRVKGGGPEPFDVSEKTAQTIKDYIAERGMGKPNEPIFKLSKSTLGNLFNKWEKQGGVEHIERRSVHGTRRFVSREVSKSVAEATGSKEAGLSAASAALGHASTRVTRRYSPTSLGPSKGITESIEQKLSSGGGGPDPAALDKAGLVFDGTFAPDPRVPSLWQITPKDKNVGTFYVKPGASTAEILSRFEEKKAEKTTAPTKEAGSPPFPDRPGTRVSSFGLADPKFWIDSYEGLKALVQTVDKQFQKESQLTKEYLKGSSVHRHDVPALMNASENAASLDAKKDVTSVQVTASKEFGLNPKNQLPSRIGEALTFVIEAAGSYDKLVRDRDLIKNASGLQAWRARRAMQYGLDNWAKLSNIADHYRDVNDQQVMKEQAFGTKYKGGLSDDYVTHMTKDEGLGVFASKGSGLPTWFTEKRKYPTLARGIAAGQEYASLNAFDLMQSRHTAGNRIANVEVMMQALKRLQDPGKGLPIVADMAKKTAPEGYSSVLVGNRPVAVLSGYEGLLGNYNGESYFRTNPKARALMQTVTAAKHTTLILDLYHMYRLGYWQGVGFKRILKGEVPLPSYKKGLSLLDYDDPTLLRLRRDGILSEKEFNYVKENRGKVDIAVRTGYNIGRVADAIHNSLFQKLPVIGTYNKWLFDSFQRGIMMEAWVSEFDRMSKAMPDKSKQEIGMAVSTALNKRFGNLLHESWFRDGTLMDLSRMFFLAPKWNEGLLRSELAIPGEFLEAGKELATKRRLVAGPLMKSTAQMMFLGFVMNQVLNYATSQKPTWENKQDIPNAKISAFIPDKLGSSDGFFIDPTMMPLEITHNLATRWEKDGSYVKAATDFLRTRESNFGRAADILLTGEDWNKEYVRDRDRILGAAKAAIPMPIQAPAIVDYVKGKEAYPGATQQRLMTTFGVKPTRYTMTHEEKVAKAAEGSPLPKGVTPEQVPFVRRMQGEVKLAENKKQMDESYRLHAAEKSERAAVVRQMDLMDELPDQQKQFVQGNGLSLPRYSDRITFKNPGKGKGIMTPLGKNELERYKALVQESDSAVITALMKSGPFSKAPDAAKKEVFNKEILKGRAAARQKLEAEIVSGKLQAKPTKRFRFFEALDNNEE